MTSHALTAGRPLVAAGVVAAAARFLPVGGALVVLAVFQSLIAPATLGPDTWLTLVAGREILEHGLPTHDHLTVLGDGRAWVDQQWLAQFVLYGVWALGGLSGVGAVGLACVLAAYGIAGWTGARGGANALVVGGLVVAGIAAYPWVLQVRAQVLVLPAYAALLALLLRDEAGDRRRTLLVLPVLALWANLHGSVVVAALLVGVYGVVLATRRRVVAALPYVLGGPLCVFLSPYASSLGDYYRLMLLDPPFRGLVAEWQPPSESPLAPAFYVLCLAALAAAVRYRRHFTRFELTVLAVTFAAAALAQRNVAWFALALVAVLPRRISPGRELTGRAAGCLGAAFALGIAGIVAFAATREDGAYSAAGPSPRAAAVVAAALREPGLVYADDDHADWLLWHVRAARGRVAYDARFELYERSELLDLAAIADLRPGFAQKLEPYQLVVAAPPRGRALRRAGWGRIVFQDETTAIVRRRSPPA